MTNIGHPDLENRWIAVFRCLNATVYLSGNRTRHWQKSDKRIAGSHNFFSESPYICSQCWTAAGPALVSLSKNPMSHCRQACQIDAEIFMSYIPSALGLCVTTLSKLPSLLLLRVDFFIFFIFFLLASFWVFFVTGLLELKVG